MACEACILAIQTGQFACLPCLAWGKVCGFPQAVYKVSYN